MRVVDKVHADRDDVAVLSGTRMRPVIASIVAQLLVHSNCARLRDRHACLAQRITTLAKG